MLISWLSLFPIRHFARQLGLLDRPGGHSSHEVPTPLGGGLGIYCGILGTVSLGTVVAWWIQDENSLESIRDWTGTYLPLADKIPTQLWDSASRLAAGVMYRIGDIWFLIGGSTLLVGLGLWDDRKGLPVLVRLGIQFAVATAVVWGLGIELTGYFANGLWSQILSVIWIVAVINAFNMLDNMDTLSGGVAAIIAGSMSAVMLTTTDPGTNSPQWMVATLLLVVAGSLLGFLFHNRPPARIFMGDGGSYLVGFLISVAMLMATFVGGSSDAESWRPHAVLAPLCAMAVPLYDMSTVLWIRIREGRSPFQGDHSHLSHRLVDLGLTRTGAVATIHLITATCGLSALLLTHVSAIQAVTVLGIVACMLILVAILESTHWRKDKR